MRNHIILATVLLLTVTVSSSAQTQNAQNQLTIEQRICAANGRYVIFAQRPLEGHEADWHGAPAQGTLRDEHNLQYTHEHIFFCNNRKIVRNIGFAGGGRFPEGVLSRQYEPIGQQYNSVVIASILDSREFQQSDGDYNFITNNCQDFDERVRKEYWVRVYEGEWEGEIEGKYSPNKTQKYKLRISLRLRRNSEFAGTATFAEIGGPNYVITELAGELDDDLLILKEIRLINRITNWCRDRLVARVSDIGSVLEGTTTDICGSNRHFRLERKEN